MSLYVHDNETHGEPAGVRHIVTVEVQNRSCEKDRSEGRNSEQKARSEHEGAEGVRDISPVPNRRLPPR